MEFLWNLLEGISRHTKFRLNFRRILRRDLRQAYSAGQLRQATSPITTPQPSPRKLRHEAATPTLPCYDPLTVKKPAKTEEASSISRGFFSAGHPNDFNHKPSSNTDAEHDVHITLSCNGICKKNTNITRTSLSRKADITS